MPKIIWKYHGPEYRKERSVWLGMRARCHNPKNPAYDRYGGRGIFVCDEWRNDFDRFYEDMGPRPDGMTIDRIDNNRGYSKDNCRWVSYQENSRNTRRTVKVEINGRQMKVHEIAEASGQKESTVIYRIKRGLSADSIMSKEKLPNSVRRGEQHGTYYEYQRWGCKCQLCKEAASKYKAHRYQMRKLKSTKE